MRLMSFNTFFCTNYLIKKVDFQVMADAIKSCNPDIVGLNEVYNESHMCEYNSQTKKLSELTGLQYYDFAYSCTLEEGTFGNGILSAYPFLKTQVIPVPEDDVRTGTSLYEPRCLFKIKFADGLTVIITHFGLNPDEHKNAVKTVLENIENEKCVLMGDFNVSPDNPVLNPINEIMNDSAFYFNEPKLTYPSDKPFKKIDYIYTSKDIKILSADIPEIIASDHRPHIIDIKY